MDKEIIGFVLFCQYIINIIIYNTYTNKLTNENKDDIIQCLNICVAMINISYICGILIFGIIPKNTLSDTYTWVVLMLYLIIYFVLYWVLYSIEKTDIVLRTAIIQSIPLMVLIIYYFFFTKKQSKD